MSKIELTQKICRVLNIVTRVIMYASFIVSALLLIYLLITFVVNAAVTFGLTDLPEDLIDIQTYTAVAIVNIFVAGIFAKDFSKYLKKELEDGTPFVQESAVMLRNLGVKGIVLSIISGVISIGIFLVCMLVADRNYFKYDMNFEGTSFFGLAIVFIAISILLEAGCESAKKIEE